MGRKEQDARKERKERKEKDMVKFTNGQEKDPDLGMEKEHSKTVIKREKVIPRKPKARRARKARKERGKENTRQLRTISTLRLERVLENAW